MASEVDIVNLALGRLGDDATVSSIKPPEGSAQATHAARFYPIARDAMLEMHPWGFSTRRAVLPLLTAVPPSQWRYAYGVPADMNNPLNIYASDATDDVSAVISRSCPRPEVTGTNLAVPTPQPYILESDATGGSVFYTNQVNAVLHYTAFVTDTTKFSPLFIQGLAILLASHMAGPILKGDLGRSESKALLDEFMKWFAKATVSDANQRKVPVTPGTSWLINR